MRATVNFLMNISRSIGCYDFIIYYVHMFNPLGKKFLLSLFTSQFMQLLLLSSSLFQAEIMLMKCETFRERVLALDQNIVSKVYVDKLY